MTIEFRDVHASYDAATPILKGVSFTVEDGEFVAFVGTNGAGKSTTMRLVNGLLKPEAGEVLIDGVPTTQLKTSELARRVGFLFQNPDNQICSNTVREELLFGFRALGRLDDQAERRADEIIAEFDFNPDDDPFLLNRGTRQLLALASIVVLDTPVVVLDEPTTGLDFRECVKVMDIISNLHKKGTTVVMVCHDMEVVADFAERVIVMSDGQVVDQGPTFSVLRNRRTLKAADLVPPQIVDISLSMELLHPELADSAVCRANTLNAMQSAVEGLASSSRIGGILGTPPTHEGVEPAPGAQDALRAPGAYELPADDLPGNGMNPLANPLHLQGDGAGTRSGSSAAEQEAGVAGGRGGMPTGARDFEATGSRSGTSAGSLDADVASARSGSSAAEQGEGVPNAQASGLADQQMTGERSGLTVESRSRQAEEGGAR